MDNLNWIVLQMNSMRALFSCQKYLRLPPTAAISQMWRPPNLSCHRSLQTSPVVAVAQKKEEIARSKTEKQLREAEEKNEAISLDALASSERSLEGDDGSGDQFSLYPDENTATQLFNGIAFKDLPYVTFVLHKNNTKIIARHADERYIYNNAPSYHGFLNAKKRTNVAGQVAGLNMGQRLRGLGIRTVRVRINGFNAARVSAVKGLVQAGIEIVAIQDSTTVEWGWPQRARKKPRKN